MVLGLSYIYDSLIMILYTFRWAFEVLKLLLEITGLYIAITFISVCGAVIYAVNLIVILFFLLIFESISSILKLIICVVTFCGAAPFSLFLSIKNTFKLNIDEKRKDQSNSVDDNMQDVVQCVNDVLNQVECLLVDGRKFSKSMPGELEIYHQGYPEIKILHNAFQRNFMDYNTKSSILNTNQMLNRLDCMLINKVLRYKLASSELNVLDHRYLENKKLFKIFQRIVEKGNNQSTEQEEGIDDIQFLLKAAKKVASENISLAHMINLPAEVTKENTITENKTQQETAENK